MVSEAVVPVLWIENSYRDVVPTLADHKPAKYLPTHSKYHCEKYGKFTWFPGVKILRKGTVTA